MFAIGMWLGKLTESHMKRVKSKFEQVKWKSLKGQILDIYITTQG